MAIPLESHHEYPDGGRVVHRRAVLGSLDGRRRLAVEWEEDGADCVMLLVERSGARFLGRMRRCTPGGAEVIVDVSMLLVSQGPGAWRLEGSYSTGKEPPKPWTLLAVRAPDGSRKAAESDREVR